MPVIINADDFGLTAGVSAAIATLLDHGSISTTTIMAGRSSAAECVRRHQSELAGRAGVHLHLTTGASLTGATSLTDPSTGTFWAHPIPSSVRPDDVAGEWEAQIESVAGMLGGRPSHLDSHHGYHRDPRFAEIYCELARRWKVPVRGGSPHVDQAPGVISTQRLVRDWTTNLRSGEDLVQRLIEEGADHNLVEVVTHPGHVDDELRAVSGLVAARAHEFQELERLHDLLPNGICLTTPPVLSLG